MAIGKWKYLVISPLKSLIEDQILEVTSMGITSCSVIDKLDNLDEVTSGKYDIVFASADTATCKKFIAVAIWPAAGQGLKNTK